MTTIYKTDIELVFLEITGGYLLATEKKKTQLVSIHASESRLPVHSLAKKIEPTLTTVGFLISIRFCVFRSKYLKEWRYLADVCLWSI